MLQQRLTRNLYTGQTESLTMPLSRGLTQDLSASPFNTYLKTDRALDLGNLAPFTIPDLSGNANTATQYSGIYVSTNGTTDNIDFGNVSFAEPVTSVTCKARSGTDTSVDLGIATGTIVANGLWQDVAVAANTKERIDFDGVDDFVQSTTVPDIASSTVTITLEYTANEAQFIELQSAGAFHLVGTLNSTVGGSNDLVVGSHNSDNPSSGAKFRYNGLTVGDVITIVLNIDATYQITSATVNGASMTTAGSGASRQETSSKTTLRLGRRSYDAGIAYAGYFTNFSVSTDSTYDWDGTVLDATSKGWTIGGSPDTTSLGYLSEFNYVVGATFTGDLSDIALYGASGTLLHRAKLYDSADASLDGYPALDCVGGLHGTYTGCAGGSGEPDILQTAGEDFNVNTADYSGTVFVPKDEYNFDEDANVVINESATTFASVDSNLMPVNRPVIYFPDLGDGTYFTFYAEADQATGELMCKYGSSLNYLASTDTGSGANLDTGQNNGKSWSLQAGYVGGTPYIYCLREDPDESGTEYLHRWEATTSGLSSLVTETSVIGVIGSPFMNNLQSAPSSLSSDLTDLFSGRRGPTGINQFGSYGTLPTDGRSGEFGLTTSYFPEFIGAFELSDGYIALTAQNGESGTPTNFNLSEAVKTNLGDAWGTFTDVSPSGFSARYSLNESHWGQVAICQFQDGSLFFANIGNGGGGSDGDYGAVQIATRSNTKAGSWSVRSTDALGSDDAYGIFAAPLGSETVVLGYCKRSVGAKSATIHYRIVDIHGSISNERELVTLSSGDFSRASWGISASSEWSSATDLNVIPLSIEIETAPSTYARNDYLFSVTYLNLVVDVLGNAIVNPRPNERVLNLTTGTGYATVTDSASLDLTTEATWELWPDFQSTGLPKIILSKNDTGGNNRSWAIGVENSVAGNNTLNVSFGDPADGTFEARLDWAITEEVACYHIIYDGSLTVTARCKLYKNGVLVALSGSTANPPASLRQNNIPVIVGGIYIAGVISDIFDDQLGDIRIYNRALTADEVLKNYQARKSAYGL